MTGGGTDSSVPNRIISRDCALAMPSLPCMRSQDPARRVIYEDCPRKVDVDSHVLAYLSGLVSADLCGDWRIAELEGHEATGTGGLDQVDPDDSPHVTLTDILATRRRDVAGPE